MKDPHENSPVVSAPRTRSGGGSRLLMSATCAVSSVCKKLRTCWSKSAASMCETAAWVFATELQLRLNSPQRIKTTGGAVRNLVFCKVEQNPAPNASRGKLAHVMVLRN